MKNRRIVAGLASAAVVAAVTGVTAYARADTTAPQARLIVGYQPGADAGGLSRILESWHARTPLVSERARQALDKLGAHPVQVAAADSKRLIAAIKREPGVAYVEVDHVRKTADVTPDDPIFTSGQQPELSEINLPAAWQTTTGSPVEVAVVDTGVSPVGDLSTAVDPGYDFVNNDSSPTDDAGHGTVVASLIAARGNNGQGMAGVCWECRILPVKVLDATGSGYDSTVAKGIVYAADHGATVINLSMGGPDNSSVLASAIAYANNKNVLVVAAAGNESSSTRSYPAAYPDVLAVGATQTGSDTRASFSNFNSSTDHWVDVAAPGIVTGLEPDGQYYVGEAGTSFSAPLVAGIAGLVKTVHPQYTGWSLQHAICGSGRSIGSWVTYGKVDAAKALTVTTDTTPPTATGMTPGQWAKVRGTITIAPTKAADNWSGIRAVDLYVDGKWTTYDNTSPFSVSYRTTGRNGSVHLQLKLTDKAGNSRLLDRWVTADNTAPGVTITKAPANKAKISGTVSVSAKATDKYGVSRLQLLINGKVVATHNSATYTFKFKASSYPKNITVLVRAYDVAGNSKNSTSRSYHR